MPNRQSAVASPSTEVAGVQVGWFTADSLTARVLEMAVSGRTQVAVGVNAHVCNLARSDEQFHDLLAASTTYADGQSVVWAARFLGGKMPERLATTDTAIPIMRAAAEVEIPVYFLGAAEGVAEAAALRVRLEIPKLKLRTHHGYFSPADTEAVLADIRAHQTGIIFVGMGDPTQQLWIDAHRENLPPAVLTCGGLFDWLSGSNRRAPSWMIRSGLEWLWRLALEPRRLGHRYLVGNPLFIAAVLRQKLLGGR